MLSLIVAFVAIVVTVVISVLLGIRLRGVDRKVFVPIGVTISGGSVINVGSFVSSLLTPASQGLAGEVVLVIVAVHALTFAVGLLAVASGYVRKQKKDCRKVRRKAWKFKQRSASERELCGPAVITSNGNLHRATNRGRIDQKK